MRSKVLDAGGYPVSSAQAGDLIFYYCSTCGSYKHIGLMINSTESIQGNYSSKVTLVKNPGSYTDNKSHTCNSGKVKYSFIRPNYSGIIPPILPGKLDNSYNVPVNVTADHKISTYDEYGNVESGRYIASGDDCYIDAVYTNGFVHIKYPTSNGDRWAYAKRDDFSIPLKPTENPNLPGKSYIHCSAGTHYTPTVLWWEQAERATSYDVKIWAGKIWEGDAYKILWGQTNYECWLDLPAGYYEAYVDSKNSEGINMSANVVSFTVEKGEPVNLGDNFYAAIINNDSWKSIKNDSDNVSFRNSPIDGKESREIWRFHRNSDGSYRITSCYDGKSLDVEGGKSENGANVQVCEANDSNAQKWFIYGSSGQNYFRPACSNKVLDMDGGKFYDGVNLQLWDLNYTVAQKFHIWDLEKPDLPTPTPKAEKYGDDKGNNVKISWNQCENATGYDIRIYDEKGENVLYTYWNVQGTSYITNIPAGNYQVGVWALNNKFNFWSGVNKVSFTAENIVNLGDNFSAMILHKSSGKPLMISSADDQRVVIGTQNSENMRREIWNFIKNDDGSYKIKSYFNSNRCLEVRDCVDTNHAEVKIYDDCDWIHQKWFIIDTGDGVMLSPECSNTKVLDLPYGNTEDGTGLEIYDKSNNGNQKFTILTFNMPSKSTLTATAGTSYTDTKFKWTATKDTTFYRVAIYKDKIWEGDPVKIYDTTKTEWSVKLPEGTYQVYISSHNDYSYTMSNVVTIKIEKGICTHNFGSWTITKNATCTADGSKTRKCSVCGKTETAAITKTGHKYVNTVVKPTCTEKGYTLHKCSVCKNEYKDTEVNATGHKWGDWSITKSATCTADGSKTRKCSVCGKTETAAITKTGHKYVNTVVKPTCTEKGYTLHKCSVCKNEYKDTEVNAAGHSFTPKEESDYKIYNCSGCKLSYKVTFKGGGTSESPYLMTSREDLLCLSELMLNETTALLFRNKCYKQTNDIDLKNIPWTPLGKYKIDDKYTECYFNKGFVYDGGNHNIFNLNVNQNSGYSGLFGKVNSGTVKNLAVYGNVNSTTNKGYGTGGIVGEVGHGATISNCCYIGNVASENCSGGIAGNAWQGCNITNCYFSGNVTSTNWAGGIIGLIHDNNYEAEIHNVIENCYYIGEIKGEKIGAIAGGHVESGNLNKNNTTNIDNCYYLKNSAENGLGEGKANKNDSTPLLSPVMKQISEDLGKSFANNSYESLNKGYPVFNWQMPSTVKGDINNDGYTRISDIVVMQHYLTKKSAISESQFISADVNDDGVVNVFDSIIAKRMIMEK